MNYLYHWVPDFMIGKTLLPRNSLRYIDRERYDYYTSKYNGREWVADSPVPPLDCLWGDVIFLSAVTPQVLAKTFDECGIRLGKRKFFKIPADLIEPALATVWTGNGPKTDQKNFLTFRSCEIDRYTNVPEEAIDYFHRMIREGRRNHILVFAHIPQILYKGTLDVSRMGTVEV